MAEYKNVTIKRYNGNDWDIIYPKTTAGNIVSGTLHVDRIPNLNASKINAGVFDAARIPNLDASKITAGTLGTARIPNLDASKITSGTLDVLRLPALAITNVSTAATLSAFLVTYQGQPENWQSGDIVILTEDNKTYIHNGGTAGTVADWNMLSTPTAAVSSVNSKIGAVTLTKNDLGLGNVDNTSDTNKPISSATQSALNTKVDKNDYIAGGTFTKVKVDVKGLVTGSENLVASDIPSLPASKITSGELGIDRIPNLTAAKIPNLEMSKITGLASALSGKLNKTEIALNDTALGAWTWEIGDIAFTEQ